MYGDVEGDFRAPQGSDDEDDDYEPTLKWSKNSTLPERIDTFVVAENDSAVDFVRRCLVDKSQEVDRLIGADVHLYTLPESNTVICTGACKNPALFGETVQLLRPRLERAKSLVGFQTLAKARYESEVGGDDDVVRSLSTGGAACDVPQLEVPNFITGICAGVLNMRHFHNLPAVIYVYYSEEDAFGLDETAASDISKKLLKFNIPTLKKFTRKTITSTTYL